jgi:hypothetical protein
MGVAMDKRLEINASEGNLDQIIRSIMQKSFVVIQPPNTVWQHIRRLLENINGEREPNEPCV